MPNRLINESSPYLLQHAHNPVDWYPWGDDAFDKARQENKPIFLSVGYATCHWCHVMERESFEDNEAAAALNRCFVSIKVDREERPDIDAVYMAACQMVTGSGGWPLSIVMTPDRQPFFAGTYIPKTSVQGRLGLIDLCNRIDELWRQQPERVIESAQAVSGHLGAAFQFESDGEGAAPDMQVIDQAVQNIGRGYDSEFGGFDSAPKFPMAHRLLFLLRAYERSQDARVLEMASRTLEAMRLGGLWDHVGFGFHRYATDRRWLLPHFEKMLYDQALLAMAYLKAFQITQNPLFEQTARAVFTYVLRDMTDPRGGFYTAEDADSEGEEGKFYVWSQSEFEQVAGRGDADVPWTRILNLQSEGNFLDEATHRKTGANILHLTQPWQQWAQQLAIAPAQLDARWEDLRGRLFKKRAQRVPPLKDDKILTDWNGLMIAALAMGYRILGDKTYLQAAVGAAGFVFENLFVQGQLLHRYREGDAAIAATANDYAFSIMGLIELYRATQEKPWLQRALDLQAAMDSRFRDVEQGAYFLTSADARDLPVRPKEIYDGAIPSANAVALNNLVWLGRLTQDAQWRDQALRLVQATGATVRRQPAAFIHTLEGWRRVLETGDKNE
jgi:uncharacterized protein YyaL (SSP411 family)